MFIDNNNELCHCFQKLFRFRSCFEINASAASHSVADSSRVVFRFSKKTLWRIIRITLNLTMLCHLHYIIRDLGLGRF